MHEAVLSGVGVVQVRDKEYDDNEFASLALVIREVVERARTETGRDEARPTPQHWNSSQRHLAMPLSGASGS